MRSTNKRFHFLIIFFASLTFGISIVLKGIAESEVPTAVVPGTTSIGQAEESKSNEVNGVVDNELSNEADDEAEEEVVDIEPIGIKVDQNDLRPWQAPEYSNQSGALGYSPETFEVPKGFEDRISFWKEIYTKYTTSQGLIHDTRYLHIVYAPIDFSVINNNQQLSEGQKRKAKKQLVKDQKKNVEVRLQKLASYSSAEGLEGEDLRYWQLFERVTDKNKFREAMGKGRVRFQLGQSERFKQGIYYSGRYLKQMEVIFREEGLPVELTRLPFVESSFNIFARSKVGASGIWQFMRSTARLFKLKMNPILDERNDPLRATRAAAKLLKSNYQMLGSWPLALTAYNHGPGGVNRIVRKLGTKDINEIVNKATGRRFGFASENFYACFLAALRVEQEAMKNFGEVRWSGEMLFKNLETPKAIRYETLSNIFGGDFERADMFNPHLNGHRRRAKSILPKGTDIRIPAEKETEFVASLQSSGDPQPEITVKKGRAQPAGDTYKVQRGDNLGSIARQFGVKLDDIISVNEIRSVRALQVGQIIKIPE